MKVVKAAAVQISPVLYSRDGTIEKATFPETVVPYYPYFAFIQTPFQMITDVST
jgi:aliphatic nitrilase